jgi:hypothetical protein
MGGMGAWSALEAVSSVVLDEREETAQKEHQGKLMKGRNCCRKLRQMGASKRAVFISLTAWQRIQSQEIFKGGFFQGVGDRLP